MAMRSIDMRIPLLAGAAIILLAFSPAKAAENAAPIQFVAGTGEAPVADAPVDQPAPLRLSDERAGKDDMQAELMALSGKMADPRMQDGVADMVGKMAQAMMDMPVGNVAAAIEKAVPGEKVRVNGHRVRAGDTVADLAGRDADRLPGQIDKGVHQAMGLMSGLAAAFATMLPEFQKLGDELEKSFAEIEATARPLDRD
jgi:hypothetical protein